MRFHRTLMAGCAVAVVCGSGPVRAETVDPKDWLLSVHVGVGGELRDGNSVVSAHYLAFRSLGQHLIVGGRLGLFVEPGVGIGDASRDASVFDLGALIGARREVGRLGFLASAGPMLALARPHTGAFEPAADQRATLGLGLDAGTSFRVTGPLGLGLYGSANVNRELVVLTMGVRADVRF